MRKSYFAVLLLSGGSLAAQTNGFLSWEQCLEKTKLLNPDLISAQAAVRELQYGVVSASSGFFPQIDASAKVSRTGTENLTGWTETDSSSAGLDLSQSIYSGGENSARRAVAQVALNIGKEQMRTTCSDVENRTRLAFIEVLYAQDLIELTGKITERRANNVRLLQLRFDGGRENAGSLARSKAQLAEAQFEQREARRSLEYARRNLAAAIGQMEPAAGAEGTLSVPDPDPLTDLVRKIRQTPDYRIAEQQVESARKGMEVTRSARFPTIQFTASTGLSGETDLDDGRWGMGISASIPLFTGNRNLSEVLAANENIIQSEMSLLDTANSLAASLQGSWNDYLDAVESEAVQKTLLDAETLRAKISTAKYKQGLLDYEDWDTIESNLISQDKLHLQRKRTSAIRQAAWRNALGLSVWTDPIEESN
jgi:outer membrane protein TolC